MLWHKARAGKPRPYDSIRIAERMFFMEERKISPVYKAIKATVKAFYPKFQVVGTENLPDEPVVFVGNHSQMNGPIACELYTPGEHYIWCAGEMMNKKEVPAYAYRDFWSGKPKATRWFYKLLSHIIAPLSQLIFTNANTIGVYHDTRIISTFKKTVQALQDGANVVIFPEHYVPRNNIIYEFQDRFIDVAKLYYKRTGKELAFVPMYLAPKLKTMYLGKPIRFRPDAPMEEECGRICEYLMEQVTSIAQALPEHTVVPYPNIPKKDYPTNKSQEAVHA